MRFPWRRVGGRPHKKRRRSLQVGWGDEETEQGEGWTAQQATIQSGRLLPMRRAAPMSTAAEGWQWGGVVWGVHRDAYRMNGRDEYDAHHPGDAWQRTLRWGRCVRTNSSTGSLSAGGEQKQWQEWECRRKGMHEYSTGVARPQDVGGQHWEEQGDGMGW